MKIYKDRKLEIEISSIEEWFEHCPPAQGAKQWVDKRSAKEMAKFWTDIHKQNEFLLFLQKVNKHLTLSYAFPEFSTEFDSYKKPRMHDLCVFATDTNKNVLIAIEGKADESYGNYVTEEFIASIKKKIVRSHSKKMDRIIGLYERFNNNADFLKLRYQLAYWFAGAMEEAKRNEIDTVFLIVQEFHSEKTDEEKIIINESNLNSFVNFISNSDFKKVSRNEIIGPIRNQFTKQINLYIGKHLTVID